MQNEVKEEKTKKKKKVASRIIDIIVWVFLVFWLATILIDYNNVKHEKSPMFCIKKEVKDYNDGEVRICYGLGYKVYNYDRESIRAVEFGPFWNKGVNGE